MSDRRPWDDPGRDHRRRDGPDHGDDDGPRRHPALRFLIGIPVGILLAIVLAVLLLVALSLAESAMAQARTVSTAATPLAGAGGGVRPAVTVPAGATTPTGAEFEVPDVTSAFQRRWSP